jgi:phage shock protein PspC (stress-responsive transcriptional regulator)
MKQVININFQGRIVPIEVTAYEILKQYIGSLTRHFDAEEGKEEIINDIENRIGELFQERIKVGATCIVDDDVNAIIKSIGRPEDFDDAEPSASTENKGTKENTNQQQATFSTASGRRRLFRDENHKLLGGVCSGIANYFDIDIAIVRIIFAILFFTFGIGFIPYIILWIAVPSSATTVIGSRKKKLFRDTDEKYIAGVCSGIANYFGINVWIPRLLFLLPLLSLFSKNRWLGHYGDFSDFVSVSPGALFIYIILWIVLPEAKTTAEKLEMKGEKVDMNSIKESVVEEMKGVQSRVQKFGKEASSVAGEKGKVFGSEAGAVVRRGGRSLGDIIVILVKAFVYFILGVVGVSLVVGLFSIGIAAVGVFPAKDFLLKDGLQNWLAWGTLLFFIITPMIAVITWIIRKITKVKTGSKMLRLGFSAMWVVGWVCIIFLAANVSRDFKRLSDINEKQVTLLNPTVNSLEITTQNATSTYYNRTRWFRMEPFDNIDEDTAFIRNIQIHIVKSLNDSFNVTTMKLARGATRKYADTLASLIDFSVSQKDSVLIIDKGIAINKTDKFRNQKVILTVYVPVGKRIKINGRVGRTTNISFDGLSVSDTEMDNIDFNNVENGWDEGIWYVMTKDGLVRLDGKASSNYKKNGVKINEDGIDIRDGKNRVRINENGISVDENDEEHKSDNETEPGTYRYDSKEPLNKFDSMKIKIQKEEKRYNDSIEESKKKISKQVEKDANTEISMAYTILPNNLLMKFLN